MLTPGELLTLRFKLTRLGAVDPANAAAAWSVRGQTAEPAEFVPFRHPGYQYEPPGGMPFIFNIEANQLQAVVDSAGSLPQVVRGAAESRGVLSFAMLSTDGARTRAFEAILGEEEARVLMERLLGALRANGSAVQTLRRFGCAGDLLPEGAPAAADTLVKVVMAPIRADKASPGEFVSTVTITNISGEAIRGPLTLVVKVDASTRVIGAEGVTCHVVPAGQAFMELAERALEPGETARQSLRFWNTTASKFGAEFELLSGPGTR